MQLHVEGTDLQVKVHRIFLDDNGQRRQGLTAQEKLQVVRKRAHLPVLPVCSHDSLS